MIRLVTQANMFSDLNLGGFVVTIIKFVDGALLTIMNAISTMLPNFAALGRASQYVAYNFSFYDQLLVRQCLTTLVYATAITIVGYFLLKTREIAA